MKLPNLSGYAIRCWGYRGSIISHPNLAIPTSSCIHPSTHNREKTSETIYLNLRKASVIQVMAILPNSRPSTGWRRGYLTNELHKRDFRCRRTYLKYTRIATIKLWRQHLGAQLPGTLPQPLKTGGTKNNVLVTKPSEQIQNTRVILNFFLWNLRREESKLYARVPYQSDEETGK